MISPTAASLLRYSRSQHMLRLEDVPAESELAVSLHRAPINNQERPPILPASDALSIHFRALGNAWFTLSQPLELPLSTSYTEVIPANQPLRIGTTVGPVAMLAYNRALFVSLDIDDYVAVCAIDKSTGTTQPYAVAYAALDSEPLFYKS